MEFREAFIKHIFSSSVDRDKNHPIRPEIQALCDEMMARLDAAYTKRGILALSK
jgi:hypothetical protein